MARGNQSVPVQSAGRVFQIIDALSTLGEGSLTEIATRTDLPSSTVYDYLTSMVSEGMLIREDKTYRLSLRFLQYGMRARNSIVLARHVEPTLKQLAEETGEIAWCMVEERGKGVYLNKVKGNHAVQPYGKVGNRVYLHNIAAGKAILARLPEERVHELIEQHGLPASTERTITDPETLFEELTEIRSRGVAFSDGEAMNRFRAVASPVVTEGQLHGSIVVSGPENRLKGARFREQIPELVAGAANALELEILSE